MIVSEYNVITGQTLHFMDVANVDRATLENLIEFETEALKDLWTNKDVFENEGAYAEDSDED